MSTAALHHIDCEWHHDQYDAECTCGAVHSREPTSEMIFAGALALFYLDLGYPSEQVIRAVYRAMEEARPSVPPPRGSDNKLRTALELIHETGVINGAEWCAEHACGVLQETSLCLPKQ